MTISTTEMGRKGIICEVLLLIDDTNTVTTAVLNSLLDVDGYRHASFRPRRARSAAAAAAEAPPANAQAPVSAGFVDAATVVDGLVVDMRYFGDNNFVGERIDGYERPRCLLSAQAANALAAVARDLDVGGLGLKAFDKEWWHFTLVDEPFPDTYFDFPVR
jgi:D-alanyl-D-alanine dipeptidase